MFKVAKTDLFDKYVFFAKLFHMLGRFGIYPGRKAKAPLVVEQFFPKTLVKLSQCNCSLGKKIHINFLSTTLDRKKCNSWNVCTLHKQFKIREKKCAKIYLNILFIIFCFWLHLLYKGFWITNISKYIHLKVVVIGKIYFVKCWKYSPSLFNPWIGTKFYPQVYNLRHLFAC